MQPRTLFKLAVDTRLIALFPTDGISSSFSRIAFGAMKRF
jgi:hypothetical protein